MTTADPRFASATEADREEGRVLAPRFDANGLVTAVVTDAADGTVLMVAHMNAEALARTIATQEAHYWSRSRKALWKKGETSGHVQRVRELRVDCDQDAVWLAVEQVGAACHTGERSCFFTDLHAATGQSFAEGPRADVNPRRPGPEAAS